jgi:hypothetical protein
MIDPINFSMSPQAPTENTPEFPSKPPPFTIQDCVTLSTADRDEED